MSNVIWETTRKAGVPCGVCGKLDTCTVSPDGAAFKCWRDGGQVHQMQAKEAGGKAVKYVGAGQRKAQGSSSRRRSKQSGFEPRAWPTPEQAIEAERTKLPAAELGGMWDYNDARGTRVMTVARFNLPDGEKEFRPFHQNKKGWAVGGPPGLLPLYSLPRLPKDGLIYVTEGEKAADAARGLGLHATTSAHGSASAAKTDWSPLAGRDVIVLPDHDAPGGKYAREVATILAKLTPPARVKVVPLPRLPVGGDIVEFVSNRPDAAPDVLAREITALAEATPWIDPVDLVGGPVMTCLADVPAQEVRWLWRNRVAVGRVTLFVGPPGEGKSFLTMDMAARVTTGTNWPDGAACPTGSVIVISAEDDPADTIRPRLEKHGADLHRVHLLSSVRQVAEDGAPREVMFSLTNVAELEAALKQHPDCRLVIIDPIGSFLGAKTDAHRDNEVRAVLRPVAELAAKYGVAVVIVAHRRKSMGHGERADEQALGSRAFTGLARAVWHVSRDPKNPSRRLLLSGKNNLAREGSGLAFTLEGEPVARVIWEKDPVELTADEALDQRSERHKPGPPPNARDQAERWLLDLLASGPVPALEVEAQAIAAGLAYRTVRRAADDLQVARRRCPDGPGWQWQLDDPVTAHDVAVGQVAAASGHPKNLDNIEQTTEPTAFAADARSNVSKLCESGASGASGSVTAVSTHPDT